jgi:hypothetical protein
MNSQAFRDAFHTYKEAGIYLGSSNDIKIPSKFKAQIEGSVWIYDIFAKYPEKYRMLQI